MEQPQEERREKRQLRGLYRNVNISVKTLDRVIIGCIIVIVVLLALDLRNPGFTITFDSKGGTDVPAHNQMWGEPLTLPDPPTREGYDFDGWFKDSACFEPWDQEKDTIQGDLTLYAGWEKKE